MSNPQMTLNEKTMSMKQEAVPLGFKQTEVGIIPKDWMVINIAKTMKLINGYGFKPSQWEKEGLPIIRIQNLNDSHAPYNYFTGVIDTKFHIKKGDLLFAWSGSKGVSFGARVWQGKKAILNQHIFKVIPDENFVTASYSYYVLRKVQEQIEKMAHGFKSSFVHVKKGDLENTPLPIPPKKEQTAIANVLSDTDTLITKLEHLITKKHSIKTATMQQLLTGHTRLPLFAKRPDGTLKSYKFSELGRIPEDWEVRPLGYLLNDSPRYGINAPAVKLGRNIPVYIRITDISDNGYFRPTEKVGVNSPLSDSYILQEGDIVLARTGASVGKSYLYKPEDGTLVYAGFLIKITPDQRSLNSKFLFQFLQTQQYWNWIATNSMRSGQPGVNGSEFASLPIPVPPKKEQTAIASILSDMDAELEALEQKLSKIRDIKQGMMQQLLTGRIRLLLDHQP